MLYIWREDEPIQNSLGEGGGSVIVVLVIDVVPVTEDVSGVFVVATKHNGEILDSIYKK